MLRSQKELGSTVNLSDEKEARLMSNDLALAEAHQLNLRQAGSSEVK